MQPAPSALGTRSGSGFTPLTTLTDGDGTVERDGEALVADVPLREESNPTDQNTDGEPPTNSTNAGPAGERLLCNFVLTGTAPDPPCRPASPVDKSAGELTDEAMNQPALPDESTGEHQRPDLATVAAEVVLPVLRRLARPGEVDDLGIGWNADGLGLRITMRGELFRDYLWADHYPWFPTETRDRLASNLQDFIAESRFGWGELREFDDG